MEVRVRSTDTIQKFTLTSIPVSTTMCARYTLRTPLNLVVEEFQLGIPGLLKNFEAVPCDNVAPTQTVIGAKMNAEGKRELALFHWGLFPSWATDKKIARSTVNARGETVATKPAFRAAFKKRRCLVIADGYYEWKAEGKVKIPYLNEIDGGKPFAFAGLWETWYGEDKNGPPLESCTLVTTDANSLASELHDRMPVLLQPKDYDRWLDPNLQDTDEIAALIAQYPVEHMSAKRLGSTFVNNARNEGPECLAE